MDDYISRIQYEASLLQNRINEFKQRIFNIRNNASISEDERLQLIANIELVIHRQTMLLISYDRQIRDMKKEVRLQRNKRKRSMDDNYSKRRKTLQMLNKLKF